MDKTYAYSLASYLCTTLSTYKDYTAIIDFKMIGFDREIDDFQFLVFRTFDI